MLHYVGITGKVLSFFLNTIPASPQYAPPNMAPEGGDTLPNNYPINKKPSSTPDPWASNRPLTATKVDEVTRILRATHPIGTKGEIAGEISPVRHES